MSTRGSYGASGPRLKGPIKQLEIASPGLIRQAIERTQSERAGWVILGKRADVERCDKRLADLMARLGDRCAGK